MVIIGIPRKFLFWIGNINPPDGKTAEKVRARQEMQHTERELLKHFSPEEKELFLSLLKKVNFNLREP